MAAPTMVLARPTTEIPTYTPNLMPFHINYTGPAAVSAFMRVDKLKTAATPVATDDASTAVAATDSTPADVEMASDAPPPPAADEPVANGGAEPHLPEDADSASQATVVASASTSQVASPAITPSSSTMTVACTGTADPSPSPPPLEDADRRFVASFRGRTIHGLTLDLPAGYGGLVLQSTNSGKGKAPDTEGFAKAGSGGAKAKPSTRGKGKQKAVEPEPASTSARPRRGRLTRSAAPSTKPVEIVDDKDAVMADASAAMVPDEGVQATKVDGQGFVEEENAVRRLVPSAQFSAFTLWQPDRVVDKNRDEYYRSLMEWISLAHEIHREDSD